MQHNVKEYMYFRGYKISCTYLLQVYQILHTLYYTVHITHASYSRTYNRIDTIVTTPAGYEHRQMIFSGGGPLVGSSPLYTVLHSKPCCLAVWPECAGYLNRYSHLQKGHTKFKPTSSEIMKWQICSKVTSLVNETFLLVPLNSFCYHPSFSFL